jgi:hypothetical protein
MCVSRRVLAWAGVLVLVARLLGQNTPSFPVTPIDPTITVMPSGEGSTPTPGIPPTLYGISGGGPVELGQRVTLTVTFNGTGLGQTYQWRKNGNVITGATTATYVIDPVAAADSGTYTVTVANADGSSVATTDLTVKSLAAPVITTQPRSLVLQAGQQALFSFVATGSFPRTYQWRRDGTPIPGATQATYTIAAVTTADAAGYSVVIANSEGSVTSQSATLTVNAATAPVLYSYTPYDATATQGSGVTLSPSLSNGSSPFTYQWLKNGTVVPGATSSQLTFTAVAATDAGRYSVIVSNVAGSATSREAALTVNAPTPITIYSQPSSQTLYLGQSLSLNVSINGSSPITYQWQKNNVAIAGATGSYFSISSVTTSDAGTYNVVLTNPAGSVTSTGATVTVSPPVAPTITTQPVSQSVPFNGSFNLSIQATGSPPLTFVWKKDGVAVTGSGSSYYSGYSATPAQSGSYTVTVSNGAGSVTSNPATIAVAAALAPTITTPPADQQVSVGLSASFSVTYNSTGTGSLTFQWLKNGAAIAGANSSYFSINAVKDSDAGNYSVIITSAGGSVTSVAAKLTVLPPAAPKVTYWPSDYTATLGQNANFGVSNINGTPPFSYQWLKDGVPIAGATGAYYNIQSVTQADLGTYTLIISNDGGLIASPGIRLRLSTSSATAAPWISAVPLGNVVYFLASSPARIERYDLTTERWLPTVNLSETLVPTAFMPTAEGVYVAYGRLLARRSPDLATETQLLNTTNAITQMFAYDDWLYYCTTTTGQYSTNLTLASLRRSTLQAGPSSQVVFQTLVFSAKQRSGFGAAGDNSSYNQPTAFAVGADGSLVVGVSSNSYNGDVPTGGRLFLFPNEDFVTSTGGSLFRTSDLSFAGSLGEPLTDLAFLSDGTPIVLRDRTVQALRTADFVETGRSTLPFTGVRAFARNTDVFVFGINNGSGSPFQVAKVANSAYLPRPLPTVTFSGAERVSVDDVYFGDGTVHVFSRSKQAVLRWSPQTRSFLSPVPLRGSPQISTQTPGGARALFYYSDGAITELPLRATATSEAQIGLSGNRVWALTDLGDLTMVNVYNYSSSADRRLVLGAQGKALYLSGWSYWGSGLLWNARTRRLYSKGRFSYDNTIEYETVPATGILPAGTNQTSNPTSNLIPPLRPNADGSLIATSNGRVVNADLAQVGVLANNILDAAWLSTGLFTLRANVSGDAEVQRWERITYLLGGSVTVHGTPQRIFALSDTQLVVVTLVQGFLSFTLVNADLSVVAPPSPRNFAGVYLAKLAPGANAGDLALYVRGDSTAALVVNAPASQTALVVRSATINADGNFVLNATDLVKGTTRTVAGTIAADGTLTGSIPSLNLTFSGSRAIGSGGGVGFYSAPAVNASSGAAYSIVAPDGRGVVVGQNAIGLDGGMGATDATGKLAVTTATGTKLSVAADAGTGALTVTADRGALATTTFAGLRDDVARTDRLVNISTRGRAGVGDEAMIAGFVVSGSTGRMVMIRAIGPTLTNFGIAGAISDPMLTLYRGGTQLAVSDNWSAEPSANSMVSAAVRVGAFALPSPGKDAALLVTLDPGGYTAQVNAATGDPGVALVEVYDAGDGSGSSVPRVINISTRGRAGVGEEALIAGIVVSGNAPKRVLVRGIGPTLATFGVSGTLQDPVLTILSGQTTLLTNDDWSIQSTGVTASDIATASASVGAFALTPSSKDAALLITLQPGSYTAQLSGKGTASGVALIEVYELPN